MSVWTYKDCISDPEQLASVVNTATCVFCRSEMEPMSYFHWPPAGQEWMYGSYRTGGEGICISCGWWEKYFYETYVKRSKGQGWFRSIRKGAAAKLYTLDTTDIETPIDELRSYLLKKWDARFSVDWRLMEEAVGSIFRDLGYQVRVTGRSNDGGIDAILDGNTDKPIGVQVKRYKDKIQAAQIRELTGALVCQGITKGIFVTTSDFTKGALMTKSLSDKVGYPIELYNAKRFYEALEIAETKRPSRSISEISPSKPELVTIEETERYARLSETPIWDPDMSSGLSLNDAIYRLCRFVNSGLADRVRRRF